MRRSAAALAGLAAAAILVPAPGEAPERAESAAAITTCRGAAKIEFGCFERRYTEMVRLRGATKALADLAAHRERNGYVRAACHQLTHRIGQAAGARAGIRAFRDGDPLCSSGYYHGVTEAVMAEIGAGRVIERVAQVCAEPRARGLRSADHYNCAHGMGHGFMGTFGSDVFRSLRGCDALADRWERHTCYGGVFMENLSAIDNPDRPPKALRPEQPLYPCTVVARRYKEPCFDKQTSYALYVTDSDYAAVFRLCSRVERDFRGACYRGLGGDVAVESAKHLLGNRAKTDSRRRLCLLSADRRARRDCVIGAVQVILRDLAGGAAQTAAFCRSFSQASARDLRRACVQARAEAYRDLPLQPGT